MWNILFDCFRDFDQHNYEQDIKFNRWKNKMCDIAKGNLINMKINELIPKQQIQDRIKELSQCIDFDNKFVVGIKDGCHPFINDLLGYANCNCNGYIRAKSYQGTQTTNKIKIKPEFNLKDIKNANILLIDDILDTGFTLSEITKLLKKHGAASITTVTLLRKPIKSQFNVDYVGFDIGDEFVIGYGMDLDGDFRNLESICILEENN